MTWRLNDNGATEWVSHSEPNQVVYIGESDQQKADKYRAEVADLLEKIAECMSRAKKDGLTVNFQLGPADAFGRFGINVLEISKKLA